MNQQHDAAISEPAPLFADWKPTAAPLVNLHPKLEKPLLRKIIALSRKFGYCFASRDKLAQYMRDEGKKCSVRTIGTCLKSLARKGFVITIRRGRDNNAWTFPATLEAPHTQASHDAAYRTAGVKKPPPFADHLADHPADHHADFADHSADHLEERPYRDLLDLTSNNSSNSAAAAGASLKKPSLDETLQQLKRLRAYSDKIAEKAKREPDLARFAAAVLKAALDTKGKIIHTRHGFVLRVFEDPLNYGGVCVNGVWHLPQEMEAAERATERERKIAQARVDAQEQERQRLQSERKLAEADASWDALPDDERTACEAEVDRLCGHLKDRTGFVYRSTRMAVLQRRGRLALARAEAQSSTDKIGARACTSEDGRP